MAFSFVDFFAIVGLGPAPIDPPCAPPAPVGAAPLAHSASVIRKRRVSRIQTGGLQCVATSHFYQLDDVELKDDAPGFSKLFGDPLPPSILDSYPLAKNKDDIADALPQFCFPTGLYLSRSGALPTYATVLMFHDSVPCSALVSPSHPLANCTTMVYVPKCLAIISHWPFFDAFKQFLKFIYQASLTPSPLPLERFICNFVDEIPLPPPGCANVMFKLAQQEFILQRPPPNKIDVIDVDPRVVYMQLSPDVIARVFSLLLLEQKVLMLSSRFTALSDVGDTLLSYLQPLTWEHVYIPILPTRLCEFLNAPTPFLMGCHVQVLNDLQIPEDVALLFIDENRLELGGGRGHFSTIPNLPEKRCRKLLRRLAEAKAPSHQPSGGFIQLMEMAFPIAAPPSSEVEDGGQEAVDDVDSSDRAAIQDCFYQCLVSLLVRYKEFVMPFNPASFSMRSHGDVTRDTYTGSSSADDRALMTGGGGPAQFRWKEFLAAHSSPFMQLFLGTSIFSRFVEDRHEMTAERLQRIHLFDEHIICKQNRANVWFKKKLTPFISDPRYEVVKSEFAPPPSLAGIDPNMTFKYDRFPALNPEWFIKKRHMHVVSDAHESEWTDLAHAAPSSSASRSQVTKRMRELCFSSWIQLHCAIADVRSPVHVRDVGSAVFLVYEGMKRYSLKPHDSAIKAIVSMFSRIQDPDTLLHALHAIKSNGITIEPFFYRVLPTAHSVRSPERSDTLKGSDGVGRVTGDFTRKPLPPTPLPPAAAPTPVSSTATLLLGCACPSCSSFVSASDIKSSWTNSIAGVGWGYLTVCSKCKHSFVARFLVTIAGAECWSGWVECMSPIVVHGEISSLLDEVAEGDALTNLACAAAHVTTTYAEDLGAVGPTFLSRLRGSHASVFWNLVWHCADIKVSFEFILPGLSVHLSSARDSAAEVSSAAGHAQRTAEAPQAATISPPSADIPTMSLLEFEQDSHKTRQQPNIRRSESSRAPTKPLPVPSASIQSNVAAPAKDLPPVPSAAAANDLPPVPSAAAANDPPLVPSAAAANDLPPDPSAAAAAHIVDDPYENLL